MASATLEKTKSKPSALGDAVSLGVILIAILPSTIAGLLNLLRDWCARRDQREITIELQADGTIAKKTIRFSSKTEVEAAEKEIAEVLAVKTAQATEGSP